MVSCFVRFLNEKTAVRLDGGVEKGSSRNAKIEIRLSQNVHGKPAV